MAKWEVSWELELPVDEAEDLLLALVVRDLIHSGSFDVELEESGDVLEVDFVAGDEITEGVYHLLLTAEVNGPENRDGLRIFAEEILDETLGEAEALVSRRELVGEIDAEQLGYRQVAEDQERWDLVVPEWLAPDEAEVPFGFRPFLIDSEELWPDDELIEAAGRTVLVPFGDRVLLFAIPAPTEVEENGDEGAEP